MSKESTQYMFDNFEKFIEQVFVKPYLVENYKGLIFYGDVVEQYREYWESNGLDFNKAQMIYLLTYSILMDSPKLESGEWVIRNYDKYSIYLP